MVAIHEDSHFPLGRCRMLDSVTPDETNVNVLSLSKFLNSKRFQRLSFGINSGNSNVVSMSPLYSSRNYDPKEHYLKCVFGDDEEKVILEKLPEVLAEMEHFATMANNPFNQEE
mmetsp:Transcript_11341/g.15089  ORF Transcript_11341/g.15089 Transcript_11341/m.15089 type:complete len:114 (+) Transcript_11341:370-711(+)